MDIFSIDKNPGFAEKTIGYLMEAERKEIPVEFYVEAAGYSPYEKIDGMVVGLPGEPFNSSNAQVLDLLLKVVTKREYAF